MQMKVETTVKQTASHVVRVWWTVQMARTKQQVLDFESMQGARSTGGDADDRARPLSSRARFVGNCVAHDLLPRACLVIRRNVTTELKLQHQGIGDKMAILLAKSLKDMPYLMKADLRCNRLTDAGLLPLLEALADNESVRDVNIGGNKLGGKTLDCLVDTLSEPKCLWKALSLPNVQLTDEQCQRLVVTLKTNTTLTELNLQENLIARDAFANQESAGTAALAELLESAKCRLQKLNIGWNFVRLNSAQVLGASLRTNCSLTLLDLSHNKLGDAGAYQLANSLRYNRHLNELRLGHTAISSCAGKCDNSCVLSLHCATDMPCDCTSIWPGCGARQEPDGATRGLYRKPDWAA